MRILLGMSGGLDSTYAAMKLKEEGHTVEGACLLMHPYTDTHLAKEAADSLGIKLHVISCEELFANTVIENFTSEYLKGRTPNPCIVCNSEVKFKVLYDYAAEHGFDMIATGHYARVIKNECNGEVRYAVANAEDSKKDQTYMLWRLSQPILSKLIFPLADLCKSQIRETARERSLVSADREESQEICFIPSNDHTEYIKNRYSDAVKPGNFVDTEGNVLGTHDGIVRYTVGQRKGLGVSLGKRMFVTKIDPETNTVTLSEEDETKDSLCVCDMVFSGIPELKVGERRTCEVKLRYLAPRVECIIEYLGEGRGRVELNTPVRALTPGQSAVFYDGSHVIFGGFIE